MYHEVGLSAQNLERIVKRASAALVVGLALAPNAFAGITSRSYFSVKNSPPSGILKSNSTPAEINSNIADAGSLPGDPIPDSSVTNANVSALAGTAEVDSNCVDSSGTYSWKIDTVNSLQASVPCTAAPEDSPFSVSSDGGPSSLSGIANRIQQVLNLPTATTGSVATVTWNVNPATSTDPGINTLPDTLQLSSLEDCNIPPANPADVVDVDVNNNDDTVTAETCSGNTLTYPYTPNLDQQAEQMNEIVDYAPVTTGALEGGTLIVNVPDSTLDYNGWSGEVCLHGDPTSDIVNVGADINGSSGISSSVNCDPQPVVSSYNNSVSLSAVVNNAYKMLVGAYNPNANATPSAYTGTPISGSFSFTKPNTLTGWSLQTTNLEASGQVSDDYYQFPTPSRPTPPVVNGPAFVIPGGEWSGSVSDPGSSDMTLDLGKSEGLNFMSKGSSPFIKGSSNKLAWSSSGGEAFLNFRVPLSDKIGYLACFTFDDRVIDSNPEFIEGGDFGDKTCARVVRLLPKPVPVTPMWIYNQIVDTIAPAAGLSSGIFEKPNANPEYAELDASSADVKDICNHKEIKPPMGGVDVNPKDNHSEIITFCYDYHTQPWTPGPTLDTVPLYGLNFNFTGGITAIGNRVALSSGANTFGNATRIVDYVSENRAYIYYGMNGLPAIIANEKGKRHLGEIVLANGRAHIISVPNG